MKIRSDLICSVALDLCTVLTVCDLAASTNQKLWVYVC